LRLGFDDKAMDYLEKSLMLDMENLMGNTAEEGLHVGGMGMSWQAVSYLVSRRQSTEFRIKLQTFENYLSKLTIKLKDEKD
jgi:trehalose/maltose hydrolase-like predicted phosphorylase